LFIFSQLKHTEDDNCMTMWHTTPLINMGEATHLKARAGNTVT